MSMNDVTTDPGTGLPIPLVLIPDGSGGSTVKPPVVVSGGVGISGGGAGGGSVSTSAPLVPPSANFTYILYADGVVAFNNTSLGNISANSWDFDDGGESGSQNAIHQYLANGTYDVKLAVVNAAGISYKWISVTVTSVGVVEGMDFSFEFSGLGVQFTDLSTKAGARSWDFGDGTTSSEINPYRVYGSNGVYSVTLTIQGATKTYQIAIDRGILLSWQDNSDDETGFSVERSADGVTGWTEIATTAANIDFLLVTFNIHGVDPAVVNYFRVKAYGSDGESEYTNVIQTQCL